MEQKSKIEFSVVRSVELLAVVECFTDARLSCSCGVQFFVSQLLVLILILCLKEDDKRQDACAELADSPGCTEALVAASCPSKIFDSSGLCCLSGRVDDCGVCNGQGQAIDVHGRCCTGLLDAEGSCCYQTIDAWGSCGRASTGVKALTFTAELAPADYSSFVEVVSLASGIPNNSISILENNTIEEEASRRLRRLQSDQCAPPEEDQCEFLYEVFRSPSSNPVQGFKFLVTLSPDLDDGIGGDLDSKLDIFNKSLLRVSSCYCKDGSFQVSAALTHSICGNGDCEKGEVCRVDGTEGCCLEDCKIIQYECPQNDLLQECSEKGFCDYTRGACTCWEGFSGVACDSCIEGFSLHPVFPVCLPSHNKQPQTADSDLLDEVPAMQPEPSDGGEAKAIPMGSPTESIEDLSPPATLPEAPEPNSAGEDTDIELLQETSEEFETSELETEPIEPEIEYQEAESCIEWPEEETIEEVPEVMAPAPAFEQEEETVGVVLPPLEWREVGRLALDVNFNKGPSTSFALHFDSSSNIPYLAFTDADEPQKLNRPTLVYLDETNWKVLDGRGKMVYHISNAHTHYGNTNFAVFNILEFYSSVRMLYWDWLQIEGSGEGTPKRCWSSSFSRSTDECLLRYFDPATEKWKTHYTTLSSIGNVPCMSQGNSFIDAYGVDASDETLYVLYSSWESQATTTVVYKIRLSTMEETDLQFPSYLEPSRFIEFKRNPYDGKICTIGRARSDVESALVGDEMYPTVYCFEEGAWTDFTRETVGTDNSYVYFYSMIFQPNGGILVAYILKSDPQEIRIMSYDFTSGEWTDRQSILYSDLPSYQTYEVFFLDGMKFATDSNENVFLYFKTYRHVTSWPDNVFTAKLWILSINKWDANSWELYGSLDNVYGTFTSTEDELFNDRSLGHLAFDNIDVPYYAFCKEAYWIDWDSKSPEIGSRKYTDQANRCAPSVFRYWHW